MYILLTYMCFLKLVSQPLRERERESTWQWGGVASGDDSDCSKTKASLERLPPLEFRFHFLCLLRRNAHHHALLFSLDASLDSDFSRTSYLSSTDRKISLPSGPFFCFLPPLPPLRLSHGCLSSLHVAGGGLHVCGPRPRLCAETVPYTVFQAIQPLREEEEGFG